MLSVLSWPIMMGRTRMTMRSCAGTTTANGCRETSSGTGHKSKLPVRRQSNMGATVKRWMRVGRHTGCATFIIVGTLAVFAFYTALVIVA